MPTVQGIVRRGMLIESLKEFMLSQVCVGWGWVCGGGIVFKVGLVTSLKCPSLSPVCFLTSHLGPEHTPHLCLCPFPGRVAELHVPGVGQDLDDQQEEHRPRLPPPHRGRGRGQGAGDPQQRPIRARGALGVPSKAILQPMGRARMQ